jgi:hypothetical protein
MPLKRYLIAWLSILGLISGPGPAGKPHHPAVQVWSGGVLHSATFGAKPEVRVEAPGHPPKIYALPEGARSYDLLQGTHYALRVNTEGERRFYTLYRSGDLRKWEVDAFLEGGQAAVTGIYPTGPDRYLLASLRGFQEGRSTSLFALFRKDASGRLTQDRLVAFGGLGGPCLGQANSDSPLPMPSAALSPDCARLLALGAASPIRVGEDLVWLLASRGLAWIWRAEARAFKGPFEVPPNLMLRPEERLGPRLDWVVLGARPTPSGSVVIAARSRGAALASVEELGPGGTTLAEMKDPALRHRAEELFLTRLRQYPEILWWGLDPLTGSVQPLASPLNVAEAFRDPLEYGSFGFYLKPNGDLAF